MNLRIGPTPKYIQLESVEYVYCIGIVRLYTSWLVQDIVLITKHQINLTSFYSENIVQSDKLYISRDNNKWFELLENLMDRINLIHVGDY